MSELKGRNVVVTGSGGGLGPSVVARLLEGGAAVFAPQRRPPRAEADVPARAGLHVTTGIDLTDEAAVRGYYAGLPPLWASVHLAGGYVGAALGETTLALARGQLDLNYVTTLLCCREAAGRIRLAGGGGRLLNVSARSALIPGPGSVAYAASKAAVVALTQALGAELKDEHIWVNAIAPGTIDTGANRSAMPDASRKGWVPPEQIAESIAWLISPHNTVVTGAIVPI